MSDSGVPNEPPVRTLSSRTAVIVQRTGAATLADGPVLATPSEPVARLDVNQPLPFAHRRALCTPATGHDLHLP